MFNSALAMALKRHLMKKQEMNPSKKLHLPGEDQGDNETIKHELFDKIEDDSERDKTADLAPMPKHGQFKGLIVMGKK
jgi:hypothetical protein